MYVEVTEVEQAGLGRTQVILERETEHQGRTGLGKQTRLHVLKMGFTEAGRTKKTHEYITQQYAYLVHILLKCVT